MTPEFRPSKIYMEEAVAGLPLTARILSQFPGAAVARISDIHAVKVRGEKKQSLLLARKKADPLKEFRALSQSCRRPYFSLDLISNCHLECTYCILQSYLENNPALTIYTNIEEILENLTTEIRRTPSNAVVGTGRIADSLALEPVTRFAETLIPIFAAGNGPMLELKTKSDCIDQLLGLDHGERTILSWSLAPDLIVRREEFKTTTLEERLVAMRSAAGAGYKIGLHFDPVILHDGWEENYKRLIERIFDFVSPDRVFWASVGTLRFPEKQRKIMKRRFPKNREIFEGLLSTDRKFLHYSAEARGEIYDRLRGTLGRFLPADRIFACMESFL